jgi:hypothetical protein
MKSRHLARQTFLGPNSNSVLASTRVGVIGLGGGGSHVIQQLAHVGVGNLDVFDPDRFNSTNLNRLVGSVWLDIKARTLKTVIADRVIRGINPKAHVRQHPRKWQESAQYIRECDAVFGCVDSFIERSQIEVMCRRYLIPYIDIGMDVSQDKQYTISGQVVLSMPGEVCMRCMGFLENHLLAREASKYGEAAGNPQVIWPNGILASTAVALFISLVTPWRTMPNGPVFLEYDGNSQTLFSSNVLRQLQLQNIHCPHFRELGDLGDPFFK